MTFEETVIKSYPTGSRYICNPPVVGTDNDTVILCNGYYDYDKILVDDGWERCGDYEFGGELTAYRQGEENYIITENPDFFNRYVFATEGAKALNLTHKDDRIKLFQAIGQSGEGYLGLRAQYPAHHDNLADFEPAPEHWGIHDQAFLGNLVIQPHPVYREAGEAPAPVAVQLQGLFRGQPVVLNQFQALWDRHQF